VKLGYGRFLLYPFQFIISLSSYHSTPCNEVLTASLNKLLLAASETSVNFYQTTLRYNPEDRRLQQMKLFIAIEIIYLIP
jgi:hypothetical protein